MFAHLFALVGYAEDEKSVSMYPVQGFSTYYAEFCFCFLMCTLLIFLTPECLHSVFHFQVDLDDICGDISAGVYWLGGSFPRSV